jgi:hypothetical protein
MDFSRQPAASAETPAQASPVNPPISSPVTPPARKPSRDALEQVLALSGQVSRSVELVAPTGVASAASPAPQPTSDVSVAANVQTIAPAHVPAIVSSTPSTSALPPRPSPSSPAATPNQSNPESTPPHQNDGLTVRAVSRDSADAGAVAFTATLTASQPPSIPSAPQPPATPAASSPGRTASPTIPALPSAADSAAAPNPAPADPRPATASHDPQPTVPDRARRTEPEPADRTEIAAANSAIRIVSHADQPAQSQSQSQFQPAAAPERTATNTETPAPAATQAEPKPDVPKSAPAHEIKLEVAGGDSRIEVRLTERGGEVKVAVRTSDPSLAGSLRDNLPALTSKLSDSGFKTETWHPSGSSSDGLRHTTESAAAQNSQDSDSQSRQQSQQQGQEQQQEQQDPGQRRPKSATPITPQNQKGTDFAWLMSTLR